MRNENPMDYVRFYHKSHPDVAIEVRKDQVGPFLLNQWSYIRYFDLELFQCQVSNAHILNLHLLSYLQIFCVKLKTFQVNATSLECLYHLVLSAFTSGLFLSVLTELTLALGLA